MVFPEPIPELVEQLAAELRAREHGLATVESCTGGLLGAAITSMAGISDGYIGGFVTYSNRLKSDCVGVSSETIERCGAVSPETALEMARGGCEHTGAQVAISVTGIAGPNGGGEDKPVGTVWIGVALSGGDADARRFLFPGDRHAVRRRSVIAALRMATACLRGDSEPLEHEKERFGA